MHLIGLALHQEKLEIDKSDSTESGFKFLEKTVLVTLNKTDETSENTNLIKLLNKVISASTTDQYKLLAMWNLEYAQRLTNLRTKIHAENGKQAGDESPKETQTEELQKEKRKNVIAEKRRAKVLAQLNQQQKKFIQSHKDFYDETKTSLSATTVSELNVELSDQLDEVNVVCIGPASTVSHANEIQKKSYHCILCQEDEQILFNKLPMVLCCYVQNSKVLSKNRMEAIESIQDFGPLFMKSTLFFGVNTTSCGHVMHANCWQK